MSATHQPPGNNGQYYRLPWDNEVTSYRSGNGPGQGGHGAGAVDFYFTLNQRVLSIADGTVVTAQDIYCAGYTVEVNHTVGGYQRRSRYLHLNNFAVSVNNTITQGQKVAGAGNTGSEDGCSTDVHLHFDLHQNGVSIAWDGVNTPKISNRSPSDFCANTCTHPYYSANVAPGYDSWFENGLETNFRTKYQNVGGWGWFGSTSRMEDAWRIDRSVASTRYRSTYTTQYGYMTYQTFRWIDGYWRQALISNPRQTGTPVYYVYRGIYAVYTDLSAYDINKTWAWYVGAPTQDRQQDGGTGFYYQYFEGGHYAYYRPSTCEVWLYNGSGSLLSHKAGSPYCDQQSGPGTGYGADGY